MGNLHKIPIGEKNNKSLKNVIRTIVNEMKNSTKIFLDKYYLLTNNKIYKYELTRSRKHRFYRYIREKQCKKSYFKIIYNT